MEGLLEFLILAALMALAVWLFLERDIVKSPEPNWREILTRWAEAENLPELLTLVEEAERTESRLNDRAHLRIQYAGRNFNITVFASGSIQDADRLALSLR